MSEAHPLIIGLASALPKTGEDFPYAKRVLWLKTAAACFDLIYGPVSIAIGEATSVPAPPPPSPPIPANTPREGAGERQAVPVPVPPPTPAPAALSERPRTNNGTTVPSPSEQRVLDAMLHFETIGKGATVMEIREHAKVAKGSITSFLNSLERKGHIRNLGKHHAPDWRLVHARVAVTPAPAAAPPAEESVPAPPEEPDDDTITPDDLSSRQRSLLVLVDKGDLSDRMLGFAGITPLECTKMLVRLSALELVIAVDGKYRPTGKGLRLLAEIKAKPRPPIDTSISMPKVVPQRSASLPLAKDPVATQAVERFKEQNGVRKFPEGDSASYFNVSEYLTKKGHHVESSLWRGNGWVIDGHQKTWDEIVNLVNRHRAEHQLPPLTFGEIENSATPSLP